MKALSLKSHSEIAELPIDSQWDMLTSAKRQKAQKWVGLVGFLVEQSKFTDTSISGVVDWFISIVGTSKYPSYEEMALKLGRNGNPPSRASLIAKCNSYRAEGIMGLVPKHKGSSRQEFGWEARAIHFWQLPSKPSYQAVAEWLNQEGHESASYNRVRAYLKSLPADIQIRGRIGQKLFNNTQRSYVRRTTVNLEPGTVYQGDGNTIDIYMRHPSGNKVWRAELTLWIDVASRYVVGWYVSEAESANSTLFALSHALISQNHIPAMLHIDNGSGYKNKMMSDDSYGFYHRLGISVMHSLPYNAKGKGHVERFFGTMQRKFLKRFPSYCGADMDNEASQKLLKDFHNGKTELPTREDFIRAFSAWLDVYHANPHRGLDGNTPQNVYADRTLTPLESESAAIFWPRTERTVRRACVHFGNREYGNSELIHYNGKQVQVEYNLHDDSMVRILDQKCRWICDAELIHKADYLPSSRIEEAKQKRAIAQTKRLAAKQREIEDRARIGITHDKVLDQFRESAGELACQNVSQVIPDHSQSQNPLDTLKTSTTKTINIEDIY